MPKTIEVKIINSYEELKNAKKGKFLKIKGNIELKLAELTAAEDFFENGIHTIFEDGGYLLKHQYQKEFGLTPVLKQGFLIKSKIYTEGQTYLKYLNKIKNQQKNRK